MWMSTRAPALHVAPGNDLKEPKYAFSRCHFKLIPLSTSQQMFDCLSSVHSSERRPTDL